jgi:tetratricopeptide (TPR) repeat protein
MHKVLRILILVAVLALPPLPVLWLAWPQIGSREPIPTLLVVLASYGGWLAALAAIVQITGVPWREWFGGTAPEPGPRPGASYQAPRPLVDFVGRRQQIDQLVKALKPGGKAAITGIVGMGGIGKTELAKVVAHRVAQRFRDGILWAECGQRELGSIADLWAAEYDEQLKGDNFSAKAAAWRSLISQKEALLIFDDVRPGQAVDELFPPHGRSAVLLTSRQSDHPALAGAERLQLDQFTPAEATALAEKVLGQATAHSQQAEATHLFELVGYLPLAVSIALYTAQRNGWRLAVLNQRLEAAGALKALDEPGLRKGLAATFQTAWATLSADQQRAFDVLAVFNQGPSFDTAAFAAVLDTQAYGRGDPAPTATALLHRLTVASLLTPVGEDRWSLHLLLRQFVAEKLSADDPAWGRMAAHYVEVARAANELYKQGHEDVLRGLALFDREWPHIQTGQAWAAAACKRAEEQKDRGTPLHSRPSAPLLKLCSDYPYFCAHCLDLRLEPRKRIPWLEAAAAAARHLGDRGAEGRHLGNLGLAYAALGKARRAIGYYEQALAIAREIGDRRGEGNALGNLGLAYADLRDARQAIGYYEQALAIEREIGDRRGEANDLMNTGNAYHSLGEPRRAIEFHKQALAIFRGIGDRRGEGNALGNLGNAYYLLREVRLAIGYHEQQLVIVREIGDRRGEGNALANLGWARKRLGDLTEARRLWQEALAIYQAIESPEAKKVQEWLAEGG